MNQIRITATPNRHGGVSPETVKITVFDPKSRIELELETVTALRFESVIEDGRVRFRAQMEIIDPALDLTIPVELIDVKGDRNYELKREGGDELARQLQDELGAKDRELSRMGDALEAALADKETYVRAAADAEARVSAVEVANADLAARITDLEVSDGAQAAKLKELGAPTVTDKVKTGGGKKS